MASDKIPLTTKRLNEAIHKLREATQQAIVVASKTPNPSPEATQTMATLRSLASDVLDEIWFVATRALREWTGDCKHAEMWTANEAFRKMADKGITTSEECKMWIEVSDSVADRLSSFGVPTSRLIAHQAEHLEETLRCDLEEYPVLHWSPPDHTSMDTQLENITETIDSIGQILLCDDKEVRYGALWYSTILLKQLDRLLRTAHKKHFKESEKFGVALDSPGRLESIIADLVAGNIVSSETADNLMFQRNLRQYLADDSAADITHLGFARDLEDTARSLREQIEQNACEPSEYLIRDANQIGGLPLSRIADKISVDVRHLELIESLASETIPDNRVTVSGKRLNSHSADDNSIALSVSTRDAYHYKEDWKSVMAFRHALSKSGLPHTVHVTLN